MTWTPRFAIAVACCGFSSRLAMSFFRFWLTMMAFCFWKAATTWLNALWFGPMIVAFPRAMGCMGSEPSILTKLRPTIQRSARAYA